MKKNELNRKNEQANRVTSPHITYEDERKRNIYKRFYLNQKKNQQID